MPASGTTSSGAIGANDSRQGPLPVPLPSSTATRGECCSCHWRSWARARWGGSTAANRITLAWLSLITRPHLLRPGSIAAKGPSLGLGACSPPGLLAWAMGLASNPSLPMARFALRPLAWAARPSPWLWGSLKAGCGRQGHPRVPGASATRSRADRRCHCPAGTRPPAAPFGRRDGPGVGCRAG